jgi:hypothetical protein
VGDTSKCCKDDAATLGSVAHYEIWHYTLANDDSVMSKKPITSGSAKGNARPYVIPSHPSLPKQPNDQSPKRPNHQSPKQPQMRLTWMQGDYYYWMVNKWYPKGYPTAIMCDAPMLSEFDKQESLQPIEIPSGDDSKSFVLTPGKPVRLTLHPDTANYSGILFTATLADRDNVSLTYSISPDDQRPVITIGKQTIYSQNRLLNSDAWAQHSTGTNGDSHPTKLTSIDLTLYYDGHTLSILRDGYVDIKKTINT